MPWPLDGTGGAYLPLYLVTLLLHAVLVGYVVAAGQGIARVISS